MKYVARFANFDSALIAQGDFMYLKENGRLVHGSRGLDWQPPASKEILEISQSLAKISQNDDGTFWGTVTLDGETGEVTCSALYCYSTGGSGYGHSKAVK